MLVRIIIGMFAMSVSAGALAAPCAGFVDVDDSNATYCSAVTYVKSKAITTGCTDAMHYCPSAEVTRLQMALFLQRAGRGNASNTLGDWRATIGGGESNVATALYSTVGGGNNNQATGNGYSTVAGGWDNVASGLGATIPGGLSNLAFGDASFAAGQGATANYDGCFVWGDRSTVNEIRCDDHNRFVVRSLNGIFMFTGGNTQATYSGAVLPAGGTAWVAYSDRASKDNLEPIDPRTILRQVAAMPISTWNWKSQDPTIRHMGPMAQDFHAAFGLGEIPTGITTVDADGVALAAIQGLYAELKERDATIAEQQRQIADGQREIANLRERMAQVESLRGELAALRNAIAAATKGAAIAAQADATAP